MEAVFGREPITIVELEQDTCGLTYGVAPCTAVLGLTGDRKCFNTRATCQSTLNYQRQTKVLRFCSARERVPAGMIPSVISVSSTPTRINIGGADAMSGPLGRRAAVTITLQDHPHNDVGVDPYQAERITGEAQADGVGYDPEQHGTFWSRWQARNPYHVGRALRVYDGYVGQDLSEMLVRHYVIDRVDGPDADGKVTIRGKDILALAEGKRAQAPELSPGVLHEDVDEAATTLRVVGAELDDYPPNGTLRIGNEVMTYTGRSLSGSVMTFTGITRGTDNTEVESHNAGDAVQHCLRFGGQPAYAVVRTLLRDYAGIPDSAIPYDEWEAEGSRWLASAIVSDTPITEPTGVDELIGELCESFQFYVWVDERNQKVRMRAVRPVMEREITTLTDDANIIAGSQSIRHEPDHRITQLWVHLHQRDPTKAHDDPHNYTQIIAAPDLAAQSPEQYGDRRVRRVFGRFLANRAQVPPLSVRMLARFRDTPRYLKLALDAKDRQLWAGDVARVYTRVDTDASGRIVPRLWQVISANERRPGELYEYELQRFTFLSRYAFIVADDTLRYPFVPDPQGAWFAPGPEGFADGTEPFRFI